MIEIFQPSVLIHPYFLRGLVRREVKSDCSKYSIDDFEDGQEYVFEKVVTVAEIDGFSSLSGDVSPIHMDEEFAKRRGFKGRVVPGIFVLSLFSRLVGVHFPGENGLLQSVDAKFLRPVYAEDSIRLTGKIDHISLSANVIVLKITAINADNGVVLVRGKIQVGFTKQKVMA